MFWIGVELYGHGRDDAERSFRADEKLLQVNATIVLTQRRQAIPDRAIRQYHFETQHQFAGHAVTQNVDAASIGGDVAADAAAALRAERQRKEHSLVLNRILEFRQNAAGFNDSRKIVAVYGADGVHALKAQHNLTLRRIGNAAEHQSGIAALGNDGEIEFGAGANGVGDFLGRSGADHGHGRTCDVAVPVAAITQHVFLRCQQQSLAQPVLQREPQFLDIVFAHDRHSTLSVQSALKYPGKGLSPLLLPVCEKILFSIKPYKVIRQPYKLIYRFMSR
ncbi:hypothetical protein D3C71_1344270 [compost metagenome]